MSASPVPSRPKVRSSGFDAARIVAAIAVVLTHSYELIGHGSEKPLLPIGPYDFTLGTFGGDLCFVTSGYLVTQSWDPRDRGLLP